MWEECGIAVHVASNQGAVGSMPSSSLMSLDVKDEVEFWSCDCIVKETVVESIRKG